MRLLRVQWMMKVQQKWPTVHPIKQEWLTQEYQKARKKRNKEWVQIKTKNDLLKHWSKEQIYVWLFKNFELELKAGPSAVVKGHCVGYKSQRHKSSTMYICVEGKG